MSEQTLFRSVAEAEVTKGRTLEGLAMPWDTWATVREHTGGPAFDESHLRSSFDESLRRDPGHRNVWSTHEWAFSPTADPIGVVEFERGSEGLMFRAFMSRTRKADEQLELVKDGAKTSVSTGFVPLKSRNVQRPNGMGKLRVESKLLELSIVPTGRGQFPQAQVLAMRSTAVAEPESPESLRARFIARREADKARDRALDRRLDYLNDLQAVEEHEITRADFALKWRGWKPY